MFSDIFCIIFFDLGKTGLFPVSPLLTLFSGKERESFDTFLFCPHLHWALSRGLEAAVWAWEKFLCWSLVRYESNCRARALYHEAGCNEHCSARIITVILAPSVSAASTAEDFSSRQLGCEAGSNHHRTLRTTDIIINPPQHGWWETCDDLLTRWWSHQQLHRGKCVSRQRCKVRPGNPGTSTLGVA